MKAFKTNLHLIKKMWQIEFFFRAKRNYDFQNSIKRTSTEIIFVERGSRNRHDLSKYNRGTTLFSCMRVRRQAASINLNKHHYIKAAPRNSKSIFRKLWTRFNKIDPTIPPPRSVKRGADTVELITRDIISGSYRGSLFRT